MENNASLIAQMIKEMDPAKRFQIWTRLRKRGDHSRRKGDDTERGGKALVASELSYILVYAPDLKVRRLAHRMLARRNMLEDQKVTRLINALMARSCTGED